MLIKLFRLSVSQERGITTFAALERIIRRGANSLSFFAHYESYGVSLILYGNKKNNNVSANFYLVLCVFVYPFYISLASIFFDFSVLIVFQLSKLKVIEQIIEEWIYCYPSRTLSEEKIQILKEQHYQNLRDDMRGVVSGIVSAPAWICREIDLEEGANWFLVVATCLDLIHSNKNGTIITKYTDHFHNNLG